MNWPFRRLRHSRFGSSAIRPYAAVVAQATSGVFLALALLVGVGESLAPRTFTGFVSPTTVTIIVVIAAVSGIWGSAGDVGRTTWRRLWSVPAALMVFAVACYHWPAVIGSSLVSALVIAGAFSAALWLIIAAGDTDNK